jgi:hypothetical protein
VCQRTTRSLILQAERVQGLRLALRPPTKFLPRIHRAAAAATPGALLPIHRSRCLSSHTVSLHMPRAYALSPPQPSPLVHSVLFSCQARPSASRMQLHISPGA